MRMHRDVINEPNLIFTTKLINIYANMKEMTGGPCEHFLPWMAVLIERFTEAIVTQKIGLHQTRNNGMFRIKLGGTGS